MHVRVPRVHVHPVPAIAVAVNSAGKTRTTLTAPVVEPPPLFVALKVNCAPVCPLRNEPGGAIVAAIVMSGTSVTDVKSEAESFAVLTSPPPETVATFVKVIGVRPATVTGMVIGG